MTNNPINIASKGISILSEVIKIAGENPETREAGKNLGETALTITKAINNVLLPIAAVNFAFDKAKKYFSEQFNEDLSRKVSLIPAEYLTEPKISVAGPSLQGLAFCHEEPDLKAMYLGLLTTAMDSRIADMAHPSYVEVVKQLSSKEANFLQHLLLASNPIAVAEVQLKVATGGFQVLLTHLLNTANEKSGVSIAVPGMAAMIVNFIRLGLIEVDYSRHLVDEISYDWCEGRPEVVELKALHEKDATKYTFSEVLFSEPRTALNSHRQSGFSSRQETKC